MLSLRKAVNYLTAADLSARANRFALTVGEFETDPNELKNRKYTLRNRMFSTTTLTYMASIGEAINLGALLGNAEEMQQGRLLTHIAVGAVIEGIRYLLRRDFNNFETTEYADLQRRIQGNIENMGNNNELERFLKEWDADWREAQNEGGLDVL